MSLLCPDLVSSQKSVTWELEYSFVEEYGIPDMSAASIAGLR